MRSRVMTGTPAVVKRILEPPQTAPHETVRRKAGCASSAMRIRAPRLSSRKPLIRACSATRRSSSLAALGELGRRQRAHDLDLVAVDLDGGAALEPVLGDPAGEPRPDQSLLLRAGRGWRGRATAPPLTSPSRVVLFCSYYYIT